MNVIMSIIIALAVFGVQETYTYHSECFLPIVPGPYSYMAFIHRYYYDTLTGTCRQFIYGGCGGFKSFQECKDNCKCYFPAKQGPCRSSIPRYYYDYKTFTCKEFIYGGCYGNENSFESFQECMSNCGI